jgi:hypothetical protein
MKKNTFRKKHNNVRGNRRVSGAWNKCTKCRGLRLMKYFYHVQTDLEGDEHISHTTQNSARNLTSGNDSGGKFHIRTSNLPCLQSRGGFDINLHARTMIYPSLLHLYEYFNDVLSSMTE